MEISVVIPAHNEAVAIKKTTTGFLRAFPNAEIIVVDDGSDDGTYEITKSIKNRRLKVFRTPKKQGKGAAVMKGVAAATKDLIAFVDADGAFNPDSLKKLIRSLGDYDCVIASKWKGKKFREVDGSTAKKIFGRFWNLMSRMLLGLKFEDTQAGLKLFKSYAIKNIDSLFCKGFEFDAEIIYRLKRKGFRINEIFIRPNGVKKSRFSYLNIPRMFSSVIFMAVMLNFFSDRRNR